MDAALVFAAAQQFVGKDTIALSEMGALFGKAGLGIAFRTTVEIRRRLDSTVREPTSLACDTSLGSTASGTPPPPEASSSLLLS